MKQRYFYIILITFFGLQTRWIVLCPSLSTFAGTFRFNENVGFGISFPWYLLQPLWDGIVEIIIQRAGHGWSLLVFCLFLKIWKQCIFLILRSCSFASLKYYLHVCYLQKFILKPWFCSCHCLLYSETFSLELWVR